MTSHFVILTLWEKLQIVPVLKILQISASFYNVTPITIPLYMTMSFFLGLSCFSGWGHLKSFEVNKRCSK